MKSKFEKWIDKQPHSPTARMTWVAALESVEQKTCEYYTINGYWHAGCTQQPARKDAYCGKCGGKVTVKKTTEERLEEAEKHLSVLVDIATTATLLADMDNDINCYIRDNGLDK